MSLTNGILSDVENLNSSNVMNSTLSIDVGTRNLGYAVVSVESDADKYVVDFDLFDIETTINSKYKKMPIVNARVKVIIEFLDLICNKFNVRRIVVEKQNINNPTAMIIQSIIMTYGELKNLETISFDPKTKFNINNLLKLNTGLDLETLQKFTTYNSSKKEHKKNIVTICRKILENNGLVDKFDKFAKKDDISDAIIQGMLA
jgi:hypothetical protein